MAPYETDDSARSGDAAALAAEAEETRSARRRKAARYVVPVTVLGVAAATIGLVPAFAGSGDPDLPKISAQELIEKIAASDVQQVSGTVKITTDLGLPDLGGLVGGLASQGPSGGDGGSAADPSAKLLELATGTHTLRVATDGPDKQKLSLLDDAAEYSVIHNGDDLWAYDSASNEVYHATEAGPEGKGKGGDAGKGAPDSAGDVPATPQELAEEALKAVDDTTSVTVDGTAQVAGRDAYKLVIKPKQSGSTVGAISIAVDSKTGLPLKFTLTPASGGAAVVDAGFTKVDFGKPSASTFDFTPPKGAKVTEADEAEKSGDHESGFGDSVFEESGKNGASKDGKDGKDGKGTEGRKGPEGSAGSEEEFASGLDGLKTIGKGWSTIAEFDSGAEGGMPTGGDSSGDARVDGFLNSLGDQVKGEFGSGTVFKTRLINVLFTEDGKVYAGAVTKDALVKAANAAK
ncbi:MULTISPECIES: LolA family protein [Streptomyces]|uniref:LolA family protein n=1 Tax=Streptomyces TaxID=1883 RepID=UPI000A37E2C5|nr:MULTISPECIES: outer membrane lipoprotein carrier protein LolA [Streptomyces]MDX3588085.1 outer membrane lipoprotein carrier protein LolA [Streptomyces europaeiscabiei]MDX3633601.1 outer membrane lipoprotein carrier protein LolA [Streptomyces europaeiscabiei]MDX3651100.1 outer membrane lipoprotein carrier protein LolA [Streptomyces europaeiscabiei]